MRTYEISCTITELDAEGNPIEGGYDGDLTFELTTDEPPVVCLKGKIRGDDVANLCT